jgi:hypothetical protein
MTQNKYPGHEGDPTQTQTPEEAFSGAFDSLMARPVTEQPHTGRGLHAPGEVTVRDVPVPGVGSVRTIQAHTLGLGHRVNMTAQEFGNTKEVLAEAVSAGGDSLVSTTYGLEEGPTGEMSVTALTVRGSAPLSEADAAFVDQMGFGEAALAADQTSAHPDLHHATHFPEAAEVARLASLPEMAASYQG